MLNISDSEFDGIRELLFELTGISLRPTKKPLIVARLRKRIEELSLKNLGQYVDYVKSNKQTEVEYLVNALTTNETFFFRHTRHFNFLYEEALPDVISRNQGKITIWSGASSTGEEPYSLAITMEEFVKKNGSKQYEILASDINTQVLDLARQGQYEGRALKEATEGILKRHFDCDEPEKKSNNMIYTVKQHIRNKVNFFQHNLQKPSTQKPVDIIFLRNVLIYFEKDIKEKVVNLIAKSLKPGGYFFISPSETLNDIKSDLTFLHSAIYQKQ